MQIKTNPFLAFKLVTVNDSTLTEDSQHFHEMLKEKEKKRIYLNLAVYIKI